MRAVIVHEHTGFVVMVVSVAADVIAAVDDQASLAELGGDALGHDRAGKTRAYDQKIKLHLRR